MSTWGFEDDVNDILALLAAASYEIIERRTRGVRLSAHDLATAVAAYGRKIVTSPTGDTREWDVVPLTGGKAWSVNVPIWTVEEGRSDLTLELTIRQSDRHRFSIEVDDLHVL